MKRIHNILYNLLLIAGLSSCVTDNALDDCPNQGGNETATAQVVLSLSIPDGQLPPTRVVSESEVNSLWVLEFENDILKENIITLMASVFILLLKKLSIRLFYQ